eukprot:SAG31_NODE_16441_length_709_cov_1.118033_2_plen_24_part_01
MLVEGVLMQCSGVLDGTLDRTRSS